MAENLTGARADRRRPAEMSRGYGGEDASVTKGHRMLLRLWPAFVLAILLSDLGGPKHLLAQDLAVQGGTVLTITSGRIDNGIILVKDGKIHSVGSADEVQIPEGITVIDAHGMYVIPGIIDTHSHLTRDRGGGEISDPVTPEVVVQTRHDEIGILHALAGGVTSINVMTDSGNPIGGQGVVQKLRWGASVEDLTFKGAPRGIKFALGENVTHEYSRGARHRERYPNSRMGVEHLLRWWFSAAQSYLEHWNAYEQDAITAVPPRRDLRLEALADILRGDILVHAHSYRADEILMLMRIAEEFGFRIATFQHALDAYQVADEMAVHGAGASVFSDYWGFKVEAYSGATPYHMAALTERGVRVSVHSDSGERIRRLNREAAKAVKYGGVDENEALAMITLNAAMHLGIEHRVGSIEAGKDADLAVFNDHPFAPEARVEFTIVDGRVYFDRSETLTLQDLVSRSEMARQ